MKIVKTASGRTQIKMSRNEWLKIGKIAGWMKKEALFGDPANSAGYASYEGEIYLRDGYHDFKIGFDDRQDSFTIYFPDIKIDPSKGVSDQIIIMGTKSNEEAAILNKHILRTYSENKNVTIYDVYKALDKFARM